MSAERTVARSSQIPLYENNSRAHPSREVSLHRGQQLMTDNDKAGSVQPAGTPKCIGGRSLATTLILCAPIPTQLRAQ